MKKKTSINGIHAKRLKAIRPFVNFDFDLRRPLKKHEKAKIKSYFDEIDALTHRPFQVYKPRNPKNLGPAQELAQHEKRLPGLKVAFIPSAEPVTVRIKKSGRASYSTRHVTTVRIEIKPAKLSVNPDPEIARILKEARGAKNFHILCGRYEIRRPVAPEMLASRVKTLMERYSPNGALFVGTSKANSNHYENWLFGVAANYFKNQASYQEMAVAKAQAAAKVKAKKRKEKRRKK